MAKVVKIVRISLKFKNFNPTAAAVQTSGQRSRWPEKHGKTPDWRLKKKKIITSQLSLGTYEACPPNIE